MSSAVDKLHYWVGQFERGVVAMVAVEWVKTHSSYIDILADKVDPQELAEWTGGKCGGPEMGRYLVAKHRLVTDVLSGQNKLVSSYGEKLMRDALDIIPAGTYKGYRGELHARHPLHTEDWSLELEIAMGHVIGDVLLDKKTRFFNNAMPKIRKACDKVRAVKQVHES